MEKLLQILAVSIVILATGVTGQTTLPPPNCALPTSSPQFATLCAVPDVVVDIVTIPLLNLVLNFTGQSICDSDCRCTHGAFTRGGRCNNVDPNHIFCECDYNTDPPRAPILGGFEQFGCMNYFTPLTYLPCNLVPAGGNAACNVDCQCSHGYPNTGNHNCVVDNTYNSNNVPYCYCGDHTNF